MTLLQYVVLSLSAGAALHATPAPSAAPAAPTAADSLSQTTSKHKTTKKAVVQRYHGPKTASPKKR